MEATVQLSSETGAPRITPEAVHLSKSVSTKISGGGLFVGAVVSETVISCVADTVFPEASEAIHITGVIPKLNEAGALFESAIISQLSVAEATPISTLQSTEVISPGILKTGFSESLTYIVWVTVEVLLAISVTIQVNIFNPFEKVNEGLLFSIELIEQLSEIVGVPTSETVKIASQLPRSLLTWRFGGGNTVGAKLSLGVTEIIFVRPTWLPSDKVADIVTE